MPLEEVEVTQLRPERFAEVLTPDALAAFERSMARGRELLGSRAIWNVNSTAFGGGVAEMLRSLIGYVRGAGIDGRWVVVEGDAEFFRLTKRLHNRLHGAQGDGGPLGEAERSAYERRCAANAAALVEMLRPGDVVILHDPQTAGMLPALRAAADVPLIWRAHIGLDLPNDLAREAWGFLTPYLGEADAYVFSREAFTWEGLDHARVSVIPPSIDAFSPKNHAMAFTSVTAVLRAAGLAADHHQPHRAVFERLDGSVGFVERRAQMVEEEELRLDSPLLAQVSRWDALKDPLGVLAAFAEHVHAEAEPHLMLAGPDVAAVADDPEGAEVFAEAEAAWHDAAPGRAPPRPPGAVADGGCRGERRDRQRAPAPRRRRRPEEPRRGLRAHGRGGDVERTPRGGDAGRRDPGPDRRRPHGLPRRAARPRAPSASG